MILGLNDCEKGNKKMINKMYYYLNKVNSYQKTCFKSKKLTNG